MQPLELEEDTQFQNIAWFMQRIGWGLIASLLLLALAGLFGDGPMAQRTKHSNQMSVNFEAFARNGAATDLHIVLPPAAGSSTRFEISREYFDKINIESITPQPQGTRLSERTVAYSFDAQPGKATQLRIQLKPDDVGPAQGIVISESGDQITLNQFFYP